MLEPNAELQVGWRPGQSAEDYHSDDSAYSRSVIVDIVKTDPATYYDRHVIGNRSFDETPEMRFGTLFHGGLLEENYFDSRYAVQPIWWDDEKNKPLNKNTNLYKAKKAAFEEENAGKLIVEQDELDKIRRMVDSVAAHDDAVMLLSEGFSEVSGYYIDPITGFYLRFRPDHFNNKLNALVDVKTTWAVNERDFSKKMWAERIDFQLAMYGEGIGVIEGRKPKYYATIAVDPSYPYRCEVYLLDRKSIEKGEADYREALDLISYCEERNEWPRREPVMKTISLPPYAFNGAK